MEILCLSNKVTYLKKTCASFVIKVTLFQEIWLINCGQGCQHLLMDHNIKMNQVSKIFITHLNYDNISGLIGILSSFNLMKRIKPLSIYGPHGLQDYLDLTKKYSRTNFVYTIYVNIMKRQNQVVINYLEYKVYAIFHNFHCEIVIIEIEKPVKFILYKSKHFNLSPGPLYRYLKQGNIFILPDGLFLPGANFIDRIYKGLKLSFVMNKYNTRFALENTVYSTIITF